MVDFIPIVKRQGASLKPTYWRQPIAMNVGHVGPTYKCAQSCRFGVFRFSSPW